MISKKLMAMSLAVCGAMGSGASANPIDPLDVDLGFIMDFSGSIGSSSYAGARDALANAIGQIVITPEVTYNVGIVRFSSQGANVVIPPVKLTSDAVRDQLVSDIKASSSSTTGWTCYDCGFDQLKDNFGQLGDVSIANFFTDGANNTTRRGGTGTNTDGVGSSNSGGPGPTISQSVVDANALTAATALKDAGWDALGFEAVNLSVANRLKLEALGFDSQLADVNDITAGIDPAVMGNCAAATSDDPLTDCFVLNLPTFLDFENAIGQKVASIVIDTGGEIDPVPLPAGLPLLLAGLGAFAFVRRKTT
ncbi:vWA domain-containing protein [Tateyamaria sp. Alg231-49]|uniref:vWA domain-containing protein n=1 Tax=Tateyamaria sp. Alg231-49 TaxID=1922219 RepID=UPI00190265F9|nr:vWA domain-containing protein [Tateyamaria sp. Alg231-49]